MASISSGPVGPLGRVRAAGRLGCLGLVAALASLLAACSAGARTGDAKWGPPPEATTRAILVGELCERGTPCECRDEGAAGLGGVSGPDGSAPAGEERDEDLPGGDAEAAAPASVEHKRLELRLRSHHDLWLRVGELTFYKDRERPEACFYIDLPSPGTGEKPRRYDVELRGSNPDGVGAGLSISELGVAARSWYHTFRFACGAPGACSFEELDELKVAARRAVAEGALFDPCGSLKVRDVRWDTRVAPDHEFPGDLTLQLNLDVTNAVPDRRRGDPNCSAR
jgi:hypothetical protein